MLLEALLLFVLALLAAAIYVYHALQAKYQYWTKKGLPQSDTRVPFGSFGDDILGKKHRSLLAREEYQKFYDVPCYGGYIVSKPVLVVKDVDLAKRILVKDFDHFIDHAKSSIHDGRSMRDIDQVWAKQMFSLTGEDWKAVRATFTPIFTSGKLKAMVGMIQSIVGRLMTDLTSRVEAGEMIELKDIMGNFSMDVIALCTFGSDAGSFEKGKTSPYVENARGIFSRTPREFIIGGLALFPGMRKLFGLLGVPIFKPKETRFLVDVIRGSMAQRSGSKQRRNDMLDLMIDLLKEDAGSAGGKDEANIHGDDQYEQDSQLQKDGGAKRKREFDEQIVVATALLMLIAGYDTTSAAMAYSAFYLSKNAEVQQRLVDEIEEALAESGTADKAVPDYDVVQQRMPLLDAVLHEALRMHPPLPLLQRLCVKDYELPDSGGVVIEAGTMVLINTVGIHYDEKFYPNPTEFEPERFAKENRAERNPMTFQSFGQGPRNCIGMRFALLEAKMGLMAMVRRFRFFPCEKTIDKFVPDPGSLLGHNKEGLWVRAEERKKK